MTEDFDNESGSEDGEIFDISDDVDASDDVELENLESPFDNNDPVDLNEGLEGEEAVEGESPFSIDDSPFRSSDNAHEGFESIVVGDEEFMRDPTDFSDPMAEIRSKNTKKKFFIALAILVGIAIVIPILSKATKTSESPKTTQPPVSSKTTNPEDGKLIIEEPTHPLLVLFDAPEVTDDSVTVSFEDSTIVTTAGNRFLIEGVALPQDVESCTVNRPTDFCLMAENDEGQYAFDVYYIQDAAHSRLFEDPESFREVKVEGSPAAGILPLQMGENDTHPMLVVVNPDSSGWMIVLHGDDEKQLDDLAKIIKIK